MKAEDVMAPVRFRFTEEGDRERFGDGWYVYAEEDLIRTPAKELMALEREMGNAIAGVMNGMRASTVFGDTACAWLGVRAKDRNLAGPFAEFNPCTMLIEWAKADEDAEDGEPGKEPGPDPVTPSEPSGEKTSSPEPLVVLPTLPVAE